MRKSAKFRFSYGRSSYWSVLSKNWQHYWNFNDMFQWTDRIKLNQIRHCPWKSRKGLVLNLLKENLNGRIRILNQQVIFFEAQSPQTYQNFRIFLTYVQESITERFYSLAFGCAAREGENAMLALAAISASRTDPGGWSSDVWLLMSCTARSVRRARLLDDFICLRFAVTLVKG